MGAPPERRRSGALLVGVIVAGAIILFVAIRPGQFSLDDAVNMIVRDAKSLSEDVVGAPATSTGDPAPASSAEQAAATRVTMVKHLKMNDIPQAIAALEQLSALDPDAGASGQSTLLDLTVRACQRHDDSCDRTVELMSTKMGVHGLDLLFDLMTTRAGAPAATAATRRLADAETRSRGSQDMQHAYAIVTAKSCQHRALILRAQPHGGVRTAREIRAQLRCNTADRCCFRDDAAVRAALEAIEKRTK